MITLSRMLSAAALAGSLFSALGPGAGQQARAIALRGTVFVGTVTCTLDDSFVHSRTNAAGQTTEATLEEHAHTTFILAQGNPILAAGTYSYRYTTRFTDPAQDIQDRMEHSLRGSFSGPNGQANDFTGFAPGRPVQLSLQAPRIPVTATHAQSHSARGHVLARNDPPRLQGSIAYPDRDTPLPILTVSDDRPALSGGVSRDVTDSETRTVDGHDGCTWSLLVIVLNGKPLPPVVATATPPTAGTPSPTAIVPRARQCSVMLMPSVAPTPAPEVGNAASTARRYAKASPGTSQASARIAWRTLRWPDFNGKVPPPSSTLAETYSGLGAAVGYTTTGLCDQASRTYTYTATYTLGDEHALFDQGKSWGRARLTTQPDSADATNVLNHEQRHFDISEVYSRLAHTELLRLLGGNLVHTFTCPKPAACIARITALFQKLQQSIKPFISKKDATQKLYDQQAGRIDLTGPQAEWDAKIDGWLSAPETAP